MARILWQGKKSAAGENKNNGKREIYDLQHDPLELHNLYSGDDGPWASLLVEFAEQVKRHSEAGVDEDAVKASVDDETRELLEALGYIDIP